MKRLITILILVFFATVLYSQTADTLKFQTSFDNITAYYDKLNATVVVSPIPENTKLSIEIFDITGLSVIKIDVFPTNKRLELPTWLKQGVYILIIGNKNFSVTRKFRVN